MENIYKVSRRIKRTEQTVYNALRSIYEDSLFVLEIRHLWSAIPLLANLRCGLWYASQFDGTCYFKSTDGHNGNWSFSTIRLNLHVATLAGSFPFPSPLPRAVSQREFLSLGRGWCPFVFPFCSWWVWGDCTVWPFPWPKIRCPNDWYSNLKQGAKLKNLMPQSLWY